MNSKKKAWVITDGKIGCIRQAEGLALALGVEFDAKVIKAKPCIPQYPAWIRDTMLGLFDKGNDKLSEPWPDIIISCGVNTIPFVLNIKRKSVGKVYTIYVQHPHNALKDFDTAIVMDHDRVSAENTIKTDMALHPITQDSLIEAKKEFERSLPSIPHHQNAIIIGGDTSRSKMTEDVCLDLIEKIKFIRNHHSGGLFISPSRRTPSIMLNMLKETFGKEKDIYIVNLHNTYNPYFGILSIAQKIFVTNDSISMISEACAAGKQVFIIPLKDFALGKTETFIQNTLHKGFAANFTAPPTNTPLINNTLHIADLVKKRMVDSGKFKNKDFS